MRLVDVDRTADTIKKNPGFLLRVKVRMDQRAVASGENLNVLKMAREAADRAGVRLMVHVSGTPIPLPQILELLGPGDIVTHAFHGKPEGILGGNGTIRPEVRAAADLGVVMDVAHAGVHCDVEVVKAALRQDFFPTTISTDVHIAPPGRVLYLQIDLVSKFHALGLPLEDAVAVSTTRPARALGLEKEIGSLAPGTAGDAAVFEEREGRFVWHDMASHTVEGSLRLDTLLTVRNGAVVWRGASLAEAPYC